MSPRLIEELSSISESYSQGVAAGSRLRLLLFVRCALGYFLMALQAIFMKVFH